MRAKIAITALLALAISGCGGSDSSSTPTASFPAPQTSSPRVDKQVYSTLGVAKDKDGEYSDGQCVVAKVVTGKTRVDRLRRTGATVATDPSGATGVKVGTKRSKTNQQVSRADCAVRFKLLLKAL